MSYTTQQKLRALQREIALREQVYPRRVEAGRMAEHEATWQIGVMRAIEEDYLRRLERERGQANLFSD